MLVEQFLEESAARYPEKVAVVAGGRRITYRQLDAAANRLARALTRAGLSRYDRAAIYLDNSADAAIAVFGILKADGVFTVIHPTTKAAKLAAVLHDCRAVAIVTDPARAPRVLEAAAQVPSIDVAIVTGDETTDGVWPCAALSLTDALAVEISATPPRRDIDVDLAALMYTSGSTGGPKGVMMTHRSIVAAATSITTYLENTPDDVILNVLPLSFDYGLYQLLMAVKMGATLVLETQFGYPHRILEVMAREQVTGLPIVPTISAILVQMDLAKYSFPALRYITNTGAALPVPHIRALRTAFPAVRLYSMYGLTECKRVAFLPPSEVDARPGSVGKAMPNVEVMIVDDTGAEVPRGSVGELVVRGSNVMSGYWERPDDTARVLRPGRFPGEQLLYSGDLFRQDEDGFLYFVGRRDDIIKTRGQKVSPREVEDAILALAGIAEAAVIGVPDETLSHAIKAIVTLQPGVQATEHDIRRHCREHLEDFMVPKFIEIRMEMPKSAHGKIARRDLHGPDAAPEDRAA